MITKREIRERIISGLGPVTINSETLIEVVDNTINQVINYCENEQETKHLEGVLIALQTGTDPYLDDAKRFVRIHSFLKANRLKLDQLDDLDIDSLDNDRCRIIANYLKNHPETIDSVRRIYRQRALQELLNEKLEAMLASDDLNLAQKELLKREQHRREHGTAFEGDSVYQNIVDATFQELDHPLQFALAERIVDRTLDEVYDNMYPQAERTIAKQEIWAPDHEPSDYSL